MPRKPKPNSRRSTRPLVEVPGDLNQKLDDLARVEGLTKKATIQAVLSFAFERIEKEGLTINPPSVGGMS